MKFVLFYVSDLVVFVVICIFDKSFQRSQNVHTMSNFKKELIGEIKRRVADKILEPTNAELLEKLISKAESDNEAMSIAELGTTYKRTGLHFDKRLENE